MHERLIRIRGIYTTALTRLFLDQGFLIADPSDAILERFTGHERFRFGAHIDIEISDRPDLQGVLLSGEQGTALYLARMLRRHLFDLLWWELPYSEPYTIKVELPSASKSSLDKIRAEVLPTVRNHHWLRAIDSEAVTRAEDELAANQAEAETVARRLEEDVVWNKCVRGAPSKIEHVKPKGRTIYLKQPHIAFVDREHQKLFLLRTGFKSGRMYDGLKLRIEEGDFCISEAVRGDWHYRHSYFRRDGSPVGAYYNINTPIEVFPDRIRYIDLEIDVVRWANGRVEIIDKTELERSFAEGHLSVGLRDKAIEVAKRVQMLAQSDDLKPTDPAIVSALNH